MPIGSTPLNDGRHIPNLAFGTGTALKGKDAQDAVRAALYAGFRHVDTAQIYGNEESVGNGLGDWLGDEGERKEAICCRGDLEVGMGVKANRREDLWVTTKYGGGAKGPFEELKESLRKLRLDYVDLYLVHAPWLVHGTLENTWREMEMARESGLARSIGLSNFEATDLLDLLKVARTKPAVNQIHLHPYIYQTSLATLQLCSDHGVVVEAYGSLYPITQYPAGPVTAALKEPAKRLAASLGQVLFLWVRAKNAVIVTTTNKEARLREYLGVGELGPLTEEEVCRIDEAAASLRPLILSHIQAPSESIQKWNASLSQYATAILNQGKDGDKFSFRVLLYCVVILDVHVLQQVTWHYGPEWARTVTAGLNIVVDVTCILLWLSDLRRKSTSDMSAEGLREATTG